MTEVMIEVRPLKPFCGSYKCALADADIIDEHLVEKEDGLIVKERIPRKKVVGQIAIQRRLTDFETSAFLAGQLPPQIEVLNGAEVLERHRIKPQAAAALDLIGSVQPAEPTVKVPSDLAASLIARGLAEAVQQPKRRA